MSAGQSLFQSYEADYCSTATTIAKALSDLAGVPPGERRTKAKHLDKTIRDAEQILQRLDMEARSAPPEQSRPLVQKVKDYRSDLSKLKEDAKRAATGGAAGAAGAAARAELGLADSYYETSAGQRERLLTSTERLGRTSERIQQGRQQLLETEELGISVLSDLQRQRETIMHSRDTLASVDANIGKAREVLGRMSRRITQNKMIMWGVIALLVGSIGLVVWAKLS